MEEAHRASMATLRLELAEANRQELSTSQAYNQVHVCVHMCVVRMGQPASVGAGQGGKGEPVVGFCKHLAGTQPALCL